MANPKNPNSPPVPVPETMEEFREMAREAMAASARTAARLDRLGERLESIAAASKRNTEGARELRESLAQTEKLVKTIAAVSGRNDENTGRILEEEVAAQVRRDGRIAWMLADDVHSNVVHDDGLTRGECDLFVVNGGEAMAVEVKRVLRAEDVRRFGEMLPRFREFFPRLVGSRVLYGALAFALEEKKGEVRDRVRKAAEDAGILLIRVAGKSGLEVVNPDREKLRAVGG